MGPRPVTTPLGADLLALLARAVERTPPEVRLAVGAQATHAVVTAEVAGRSVDVVVTGDVAVVPAPDGPLRPVPQVVDADGRATGELLVWVRDGRLTGLERPWWTDEAPTDWPAPSDLRLT